MEDEPLDDARAAAMTAGATAARVTEIVARDLQARAQQRQDAARRQGEAAVSGLQPERFDSAAAARAQAQRTELEQARQWATPEILEDYRRQRDAAESREGRESVDRSLISEWKAATTDDRASQLARAEVWAGRDPQRLEAYWTERDKAFGPEKIDTSALRTAEDKLLGEHRAAEATYDSGRGDRDATMRAQGVPDDAREAKTTADLLNGTDPAGAAKSGSKTRAKKATPAASREPVRGR